MATNWFKKLSGDTKKAEPSIQMLMTLPEFISHHEALADKRGVVVTQIRFPRATEHVYTGIYSGIVVTNGEAAATYSDGSQH